MKKQRILDAISGVTAELEVEKTGLLNRFEAAQFRASALLGLMEAGDAGNAPKAPLTEMEQVMLYCERRTQEIETLQQQLLDLRQQAEHQFAMTGSAARA